MNLFYIVYDGRQGGRTGMVWGRIQLWVGDIAERVVLERNK